MTRALKELKPQPPIKTAEWVEQYLKLPSENSDSPGDFSMYYTPYLFGVFAAMDDPEAEEVVCSKAAQVAWTTALIGYILKRVDCEPSAIIGMFASEGAARDFSDEKVVPIIKATPKLRGKIDVGTSRKSGNRALHKNFPGGFLKLISSNAIRSVKSTPAKFVFVEEPDDANENVKEQGDSVLLLYERTKRQRKPKKVLGGTPSVKGFSRVERHVKRSDQRVLPVECHDCGESHVLDFSCVKWDEADHNWHEEYGKALPQTAIYACPHCGSIWDDFQRKENIRNTVYKAIENGDPMMGWVATQPFSGVAGFINLSELYTCLPGAGLQQMVEAYLQSEYQAGRGDENARIVFQNSKLGLPYEYADDRDDSDTLLERAEEDDDGQHEEMTCPRGGILLTCGIDVQDDRLEIVIRAWGRGEESWLIYYGAIYAKKACLNEDDPVWSELDKIVFSAIPHESGSQVYVSAISIDSSDGDTNDAVYKWVRTRQKTHPNRLVMAIKGASHGDPEIFVQPKVKSIDHTKPAKQTKADKKGVKVFIVGTNKAKDWISGKIKLAAKGENFFHAYKGVRKDYFDHLCGEAKIPGKNKKKVWTRKSGCRVEAWDCEVYALHAARAKRVHLLKPQDWDKLQLELDQSDLFATNNPDDQPQEKPRERRKSSYW